MKFLFILLALLPVSIYANSSIEERLSDIEEKLELLTECKDFSPSGSVIEGSPIYKLSTNGDIVNNGRYRSGFDAVILKTGITFEKDSENRIFAIVRTYSKPCMPFKGTELVNMKYLIQY